MTSGTEHCKLATQIPLGLGLPSACFPRSHTRSSPEGIGELPGGDWSAPRGRCTQYISCCPFFVQMRTLHGGAPSTAGRRQSGESSSGIVRLERFPEHSHSLPSSFFQCGTATRISGISKCPPLLAVRIHGECVRARLVSFCALHHSRGNYSHTRAPSA